MLELLHFMSSVLGISYVIFSIFFNLKLFWVCLAIYVLKSDYATEDQT